MYTVKIVTIQTLQIHRNTVVILKFELGGFSTEYSVQKLQMEWQTV